MVKDDILQIWYPVLRELRNSILSEKMNAHVLSSRYETNAESISFHYFILLFNIRQK